MGQLPTPVPAGNTNRVGIHLDALHNIIVDLNENTRLQGIFGTPVSASLAVVSDQNDLRIEHCGDEDLTGDQVRIFLQELDTVVANNSM